MSVLDPLPLSGGVPRPHAGRSGVAAHRAHHPSAAALSAQCGTRRGRHAPAPALDPSAALPPASALPDRGHGGRGVMPCPPAPKGRPYMGSGA
jgi:hypothetical protein